MVDRRPSGQAANGKDTVISLQELLSSNAPNPSLQPTAGRRDDSMPIVLTLMDFVNVLHGRSDSILTFRIRLGYLPIKASPAGIEPTFKV